MSQQTDYSQYLHKYNSANQYQIKPIYWVWQKSKPSICICCFLGNCWKVHCEHTAGYAHNPSVFWRCWLGNRKGIWPVMKNLNLVCGWQWLDCSYAHQRILTATATISHTSCCSNKSRMIWYSGTSLPRLSQKMAIKTCAIYISTFDY